MTCYIQFLYSAFVTIKALSHASRYRQALHQYALLDEIVPVNTYYDSNKSNPRVKALESLIKSV